MRSRDVVDLAIGISAALIAIPVAAQQEPAVADLVGQVHLQGHPCKGSVSAQRDPEQSRPDEPVWILKCLNATYRVRVIRDMAARIARLE